MAGGVRRRRTRAQAWGYLSAALFVQAAVVHQAYHLAGEAVRLVALVRAGQAFQDDGVGSG